MTEPSRIRLWLRALFRPWAVERELTDELRHHIELETERNVRAGMDPAAARRKAKIDFGGEERYKEQTRDARSTRPLEDVLQDLRYGLRQLRKHPGFTAVALLSLALGIGANTAIFSVVNAVLLRPLPFQDPDRIVVVEEWAASERNPTFSPRDFLDLKEQSASFEHLVGYRALSMSYMGSEGPERIEVRSVTPDFFQAFGVSPALGRFFEATPEEDGAGKMVVLSQGAWQNRFGGDPSVLGRPLTLDGEPRAPCRGHGEVADPRRAFVSRRCLTAQPDEEGAADVGIDRQVGESTVEIALRWAVWRQRAAAVVNDRDDAVDVREADQPLRCKVPGDPAGGVADAVHR